VIAGFGFLRRYKGLLTTVRVIAALRTRFPGISYRGHHAVYPSDDSAGYLDECLLEADRLGVRELIHISTDFAPMDAVMRDMREADVIVLPYMPSEEGASAAANAALASGTPVVASQSRIFDSVRGLLLTPPGENEADYAQVIAALLNDEPMRRMLGEAALAWLVENSYESTASRFIALHT
jgi:glycosyltransferase involved in cell wall biosynthesis